jgi:hypothetical protein
MRYAVEFLAGFSVGFAVCALWLSRKERRLRLKLEEALSMLRFKAK